LQLWLGVLCMVLIANLQYAWTLFVDPMHQAHGWSIAEIQVAFSIFIATETWLTPIEGYIVDRLGPSAGPRLMVTFGLLVGIAWVINAYATSLEMLYLGAAISGIGAGAIYATCVGNAVKWFPDRRGLAVGLTAAGFGAGAALTVIPIRLVIDAYGYAAAFLWFGLLQGVILLLVAQTLRGPAPFQAGHLRRCRRGRNPSEEFTAGLHLHDAIPRVGARKLGEATQDLFEALKFFHSDSELAQNFMEQRRTDFATTVARNGDTSPVQVYPSFVTSRLALQPKSQPCGCPAEFFRSCARHGRFRWCPWAETYPDHDTQPQSS